MKMGAILPSSPLLYDDEIPVMNFDPMSLTDDIKGLINRGFRSQSVQLTKISTQLEKIYNILQEKKIGNFSEICNTGNFTKKYQIDLPFKNLEDFQNFDSKLKTDTKFQEDKFDIWTLVDSKSSLTHTVMVPAHQRDDATRHARLSNRRIIF
ncbi:uncharacterized protein LOC113004758 [Solenopsis invicta]|uniref:uncharacterized protein LOC113004758 n=1 Tax=Solenopsis invicta TaxID=13686 RepID=UPI00193D41FE|nr:uncharacterized protein LOC113004758 [Solenopsis invicta]XP_039307268.1 uncharacterized protein LOC113004758 [Solenopsis invicta]